MIERCPETADRIAPPIAHPIASSSTRLLPPKQAELLPSRDMTNTLLRVFFRSSTASAGRRGCSL